MQGETHTFAIEQINQILGKAIEEKASDLHFEPNQNGLNVRFRIDGLLRSFYNFPKEQRAPLISRLKIMGSLDISEHRLPQDGRFSFKTALKEVDCRLSTCATTLGEKVVVRLLNHQTTALSLDVLGMNKKQLATFKEAIQKPQGMILVTGPTGSGKTLTLYSALEVINQIEKNILTIEDPVEIQLEGVNQTHVNPKIGLTFSKVLRTFLRQDPDIIMLGEIRDEETARIAVQAAQTGHLVFSTLHTNSALESIVRLANMGIEPYNIASSLSLVVSQRLVRKLCEFCRKNNQPVGCDHCYEGCSGRVGLFEVLPITEDLRRSIDLWEIESIQSHYRHASILTLKQSAKEKLAEGVTSFSEVERVLG